MGTQDYLIKIWQKYFREISSKFHNTINPVLVTGFFILSIAAVQTEVFENLRDLLGNNSYILAFSSNFYFKLFHGLQNKEVQLLPYRSEFAPGNIWCEEFNENNKCLNPDIIEQNIAGLYLFY